MSKNFWEHLTKEDLLQNSIIRYIDLQYPDVYYFHVPNEGKRTYFERFNAKVLGIKSGVSDLFLFCTNKMLILEVKQGKNKPTKNQQDFLDKMCEFGFNATWCNSFDSAKKIIDKWYRKDDK